MDGFPEINHNRLSPNCFSGRTTFLWLKLLISVGLRVHACSECTQDERVYACVATVSCTADDMINCIGSELGEAINSTADLLIVIGYAVTLVVSG